MIKKCPYVKTFTSNDCIKLLNRIEKNWENLNPPVKKRWVEAIIKEKKKNIPFLILISTLLSLRTQDKITYQASKRLFKSVNSPQDLNNLSEEEIENLIYPVWFYKNKAKNLKKIAKILIEKYNWKVPDNLEELLKLPGVGRKTANLVLTLWFWKNWICVDTHVHRICNRLWLIHTKTPEETEKELKKVLPKKYRKKINKLLIWFWQTICKPLKPNCEKCPIYKKGL